MGSTPITPDNPNVWYELGYAVASDQSVVMICAEGRKLPFDIHHKMIIFYTAESLRDFEQLRDNITNRLNALLERQAKVQEVASPVKPTEGLQSHEIAVLALILANRQAPQDSVFAYSIKQDMRQAGYTDTATNLGLLSLEREQYVRTEAVPHFDEEAFAYWLLERGEDWLLQNMDKLQLRRTPPPPPRVDHGITDDDVPF